MASWFPVRTSRNGQKQDFSIVHGEPVSNSWLLMAVYGPLQVATREAFWNNIHSIQDKHPLPWLIFGDLNSTLFDAEKNGPGSSSKYSRSSKAFRNAVANLGLIGLGASRGTYMWRNRRCGFAHCRARLDRALCDTRWRCLHPKAGVSVLVASFSDQNPLLLNTSIESPVPRRFKFEAAWTRDSCSTLVVQKAWLSYSNHSHQRVRRETESY